ncbi:MAG: glycosyltransferase family 9 protein [Haliscomenobacteraceae bacterium CHB4]|nr:Lipopolysaccharide core heptosyltransferase RfaQ [Saprospiraceae bacterium]MCE7923592.1 glycosyltransferase family 9 protein [Haliscomenobacteraceae bacterium CHB4]
MKFLIVQSAFIGDVVLATPLVEKLCRFFPEAEIDFLLRKGNEKLLAGHPHLRRVYIWNKKQEKYAGLFRILRALRKERYDWVINCQRFAASGLLTIFSGAIHTVGFDKNPFSFAFSRRTAHRFGTREYPVHEVERNLQLIEHLTDRSFERPKLYPHPADYEKAESLAGGRPYVCIAPTSVWFTKQFPAHKWVELTDKIPSGHLVFLLGGKEDAGACDQICAASGRTSIRSLAGQLSFLESAALMQGAAMNYANDSAPVHIASAVNAPITAVFCSTIPAFGFTPLSDRSFVVETTDQLDCRPCGLHGRRACPRGHFACAESIGVERFPEP